MRLFFVLCGITVVATAFFATQKSKIYPKDLQQLTGKKWKGVLTYLDYSSNQQTTIEANLLVKKGNNNRTWYFSNEYPKEPKENNADTVILSADGYLVDDEKIISRKDSGTTTIIVTLKDQIDDGVKKSFRYTYRLSPVNLSIEKEEKAAKNSSFFRRNIYLYQR